jgi:hypothetical protein
MLFFLILFCNCSIFIFDGFILEKACLFFTYRTWVANQSVRYRHIILYEMVHPLLALFVSCIISMPVAGASMTTAILNLPLVYHFVEKMKFLIHFSTSCCSAAVVKMIYSCCRFVWNSFYTWYMRTIALFAPGAWIEVYFVFLMIWKVVRFHPR